MGLQETQREMGAEQEGHNLPPPCLLSGAHSVTARKRKQPDAVHHHLALPPETTARRQHAEPDTYHNNKDDRASKAPDEGFMDGDPAEVRVPIALWVQPDSKAFAKRRSKANAVYSKF